MTHRAMKCATLCASAVCALLLGCAQTAAASPTRQNILRFAEQEIGYHDHGYYCTKFGPCETWCSLFLTWVWRQAGVPVPSLAFTGYLYDWARASTYVLSPRALPQPGDAVLFGTGPWTVNTSLHTGIVQAVYPGYLVTIEGDSQHGVRRYVVPLRNPQLVGEPGPIYGYASPVGLGGGHAASVRAMVPAFPALPRALVMRQEVVRRGPSEEQRLLSAIAALRAFQHMPYRSAGVLINWTAVNRQGQVEVTVTSPQPMSYAVNAWQAFLRRFDDAGHAYVVSFDVPPATPVANSAPTISGTASEGQTLTESHGLWSNAPSAYTYQWEVCDASGQNCSTMNGATGQTYTLGAFEVGHTIRVQETATNSAGAGQPAISAATAVVASEPVSQPPASGG